MTNERDESIPHWLRTAAPIGANAAPPGLPPTGPWQFPRIDYRLLAAIDPSKLPIPPATPLWFPPATPAMPEHLQSAEPWGAAPTLPGAATAPPLSTRGILGALGQPQYGNRDQPAWPPGRNAFDGHEWRPLPSEPDLLQDALRAGAATIARHDRRENVPPGALAANDPPFTPFGPAPKAPGEVVDVKPVPNIFSGQDGSMMDRWVYRKLLYDPQNLQTKGFYSGDYTDTLGSNYLDPTPMESRHPDLYWRPPGLDK